MGLLMLADTGRVLEEASLCCLGIRGRNETGEAHKTKGLG